MDQFLPLAQLRCHIAADDDLPQTPPAVGGLPVLQALLDLHRQICQVQPDRRVVGDPGLPVGLIEFERTRLLPGAHPDVKAFDANGECHREIDVAFGDSLVEAFGDEGAANKQQEAQGESLIHI